MIVIKDLTMGTSWTFVATKEGYASAYARIQAIIGQGHRAGGDVARVYAYCG